MARTPVQFRHNGVDVAVFVDGGANLLNALRDGVGDTAPKFGCGQGTCGVCTVLVDGEPHLSCLTLAESVAGPRGRDRRRAQDRARPAPAAARLHGRISPPSAASARPGMLMAAKALLDRNPAPTRDEVVEAISGNICRCTGYEPIINAILAAARAGSARSAPEEVNHAGIPQGILRRRARRQPQRDRQADAAPGHARPCHRHDRLLRRPPARRACCTSRCCAARTTMPASAASTRAAAERAPGVRARDPRRRRAAQPQHAAQPARTSARTTSRRSRSTRCATRASRSSRSSPSTEREAFEALAQGPGRLRAAAAGLRRRGGAQARRAGGQRDLSEEHLRVSRQVRPPEAALRRRRGGLRAQPTTCSRSRYQMSPIEHAPTETNGCDRRARDQRPLRRLHLRAGAVLLARHHREDPRRAVEPAAFHRRHRRRRLRRQGRLARPSRSRSSAPCSPAARCATCSAARRRCSSARRAAPSASTSRTA